MPKSAPGLAAALAAALACGCQAPSRPDVISADGVMLEVPVVRQDELYECGFAAVSAVCQYYQVPIPEQERDELLRTAAERHGISGAELRAVLERIGMEVYIFQGALDHSDVGLYGHVDQGRPLLVMTAPGGGDDFHYSLFAGYDAPLGNVFLLDPRRGLVALPTAAFEHQWERAQRFTLLCVPASSQKESS